MKSSKGADEPSNTRIACIRPIPSSPPRRSFLPSSPYKHAGKFLTCSRYPRVSSLRTRIEFRFENSLLVPKFRDFPPPEGRGQSFKQRKALILRTISYGNCREKFEFRMARNVSGFLVSPVCHVHVGVKDRRWSVCACACARARARVRACVNAAGPVCALIMMTDRLVH